MLISLHLEYLKLSKTKLANEFAMIDSDDLGYHFNIQVVYNKKAKSIFITKEKYIECLYKVSHDKSL